MDQSYEEWENSLEGIHYNTTMLSPCRHAEYDEEYTIIRTLAKIDKEIREDVMENAAFIIANCSFVWWNPMSKALIVLNFDETETEEDRQTTVAHEIAHYVLEHYTGGKLGNISDEKDADDLCEKWGFGRAYKTYDDLPKLNFQKENQT